MTDPDLRALVERLNAVQPLDFSPHAIPVELCAEAAAAVRALAAENARLREALRPFAALDPANSEDITSRMVARARAALGAPHD